MKAVNLLATVLLIVGGLNWGLWGAFEFDLVAALFGGNTSALSKVVYIVVGLAAVSKAVMLVTAPKGSRPVLAMN